MKMYFFSFFCILLLLSYSCKKSDQNGSFTPPNWLKGEWVSGNTSFIIGNGQLEEKRPQGVYNHLAKGFVSIRKHQQFKVTTEGFVRQFDKTGKDELTLWIYESDDRSGRSNSAHFKRIE